MAEADRPETKTEEAGGEQRTAALPIVGVGASAGGLEALREMLGAVRNRTGMAFVVVQHLDPDHESMMAQLIARETALTVKQVDGGERPQADHVYIIPPGKGLALREGMLELDPFELPRGQRRPIDDFLVSLAEERGELAAGVILSGTGGDGAFGLRAIKEHGGLTIAQEPTSARYDGMPLSAVNTGLVDFVQEPGEIVNELTDYFGRLTGDGTLQSAATEIGQQIDTLCEVLRDAVGHDFSGYKRSTVERRIARRMQVLGLKNPEAYVERLRSDHDECDALFRDMLINVTRFYRDADHFDALRENVIRPLIEDQANGDELRVWVPGCSSGEEPYTIAMMIASEMDQQRRDFPVQIFATDIDETMLDLAREARYPPAAIIDLPQKLRDNFMLSHGDHLTVVPRVRDMVRFSNHSILKDAPFSKLDLVSCRNLLIYFGDRLQQAVIPLLHYSIRPGGYLMLGPSESIGRFEDLFEPVNLKSRLFRRTGGRGTYPAELQFNTDRKNLRSARQSTRKRRTSHWDGEPALKRIVERYAPAAMVLDPFGEIVASFGRLSRYFEFPTSQTGEASATSLARPGLREVLVPMLREVGQDHTRIIAREVDVKSEFGTQQISVIADPLPDGNTLVVFRETAEFRAEQDEDLAELGPNDGQVQILEDELRLARHRLRCTVEELETVNEELKSSNEEMMSMNEELQSTNEELTTVNDELKSKVDQLTVANADLKNFFESTQLAVIVLDGELRIRSYTAAAENLFPLQPSDRGRRLDEMTTSLTDSQYLDDARAIAAGKSTIERQILSKDGRVFLFRAMPYRVLDGSVSGATLVFTEISEVAKLEAELQRERERLKLALEVSGIGVWEYWVNEEEARLDPSVADMFGLERSDRHDVADIVGAIHPEDRSRVEAALRRAIAGDEDYSVTFRVPSENGDRTLRGLGRLVEGRPVRLVGVNFDITSEAESAAMRELMLREMNHRVKNLFAVIAGLVSLAAREAPDKEAMGRGLRERIAALGRAHSLTNAEQDDSGNLGDLVRASLAPYGDHEGISIEGPNVAVRANAVSSLALLLHEWATNSMKYGALGNDGATLKVDWQPQDDGAVVLHWDENLASARNVGDGEGFGTTLVAASVRQIGAEVEDVHDERSFQLTLRLPPKALQASAAGS